MYTWSKSRSLNCWSYGKVMFKFRGNWQIVFKSHCHCHYFKILPIKLTSVVDVLLCLTLCDPRDCSMPGFSVLYYLLEFAQFMFIESMMPSNHLIHCHPLLLQLSIFPSIRVFSNESALCTRWPKYWSFNFSISPSNEHSGLISFRIDWFDLPVVQGTLKSLDRHHSLKASVLWC